MMICEKRSYPGPADSSSMIETGQFNLEKSSGSHCSNGGVFPWAVLCRKCFFYLFLLYNNFDLRSHFNCSKRNDTFLFIFICIGLLLLILFQRFGNI